MLITKKKDHQTQGPRLIYLKLLLSGKYKNVHKNVYFLHNNVILYFIIIFVLLIYYKHILLLLPFIDFIQVHYMNYE